MAKLEFKLSKEQHEALDESLKQFYVATQDGGFELEGVGSIQRALETEKKGKEAAINAAIEKAKAEALKPYEGLDVEAAKAAIEAAAKAEEDKKKKAGDFDGIKAQLEERHAKDLEKKEAEKQAVENEKATILSNLTVESIKTLATSKYGVSPKKIKSALAEGNLLEILELESGENGFKLRKKGGIGDEPEIDAIFTDLKENAPWVFDSNLASGSGASGSQSNGGGKRQVTRAEYDTNPATYGSQAAKGEITIID